MSNFASAAYMQAVVPQSITASPTGSNVIDTAGYDYMEVIISFGAIGANFPTSGGTTQNTSSLFLQESATRTNATTLGGTIYAVPGATFGLSQTISPPTALYNPPEVFTNPTSALPLTAAGNNGPNTIWLINVDLKGRQRFQQIIVYAGGTATLVDVIVRLSKTEIAPHNPAQFAAPSQTYTGQVLQVPPYGTLQATTSLQSINNQGV
jgi:hypothetical protein